MSYARSPRPSLVMTVGIKFTGLTPCVEADAGFRSGWRVRHRQVGAEVGDAAQRLEGKGRGGQPELDRRILRPGALLRVRAQQPREVGIDVGGPRAERVGNGEEPLGGDFLAASFHLGAVSGRKAGLV